MEKLIPVELLERYINGECTEAEIASVKRWYQSFEYDDDHVSGMSLSEEKELEERIYNHILLKIGHTAGEEVTVTPRNYSILRKWYSITAAAVLLFAVMLVLYKNQENKMLLAADSGSSQLVSITNNSGQIYKVTL